VSDQIGAAIIFLISGVNIRLISGLSMRLVSDVSIFVISDIRLDSTSMSNVLNVICTLLMNI
jgi:hypothetical protein